MLDEKTKQIIRDYYESCRELSPTQIGSMELFKQFANTVNSVEIDKLTDFLHEVQRIFGELELKHPSTPRIRDVPEISRNTRPKYKPSPPPLLKEWKVVNSWRKIKTG